MMMTSKKGYATSSLRSSAKPMDAFEPWEPVRISSGESSGLTNAVVVPPLKVRDFTFTSLSDAI